MKKTRNLSDDKERGTKDVEELKGRSVRKLIKYGNEGIEGRLGKRGVLRILWENESNDSELSWAPTIFNVGQVFNNEIK